MAGFLIRVFVLVFIMIIFFAFGYWCAARVCAMDFYPAIAEVTEVDLEYDMVFFTLQNGHVYGIYGAEDWEIGDRAVLVMDGRGTDNPVDARVISARYIVLPE